MILSVRTTKHCSCLLMSNLSVSAVRTQVIARIKTLQVLSPPPLPLSLPLSPSFSASCLHVQNLNSSAIRARERTEAEKFYLLEICKSLPSSAISSAASAVAAVNPELHPRFSQLVSQHGLPIAASDAASVTLAASLAEVRFFQRLFPWSCCTRKSNAAHAGHAAV